MTRYPQQPVKCLTVREGQALATIEEVGRRSRDLGPEIAAQLHEVSGRLQTGTAAPLPLTSPAAWALQGVIGQLRALA